MMKVSISIITIAILNLSTVLAVRSNQTRTNSNTSFINGKVVSSKGFQAIVIERKIANDQLSVRNHRITDQKKKEDQRQRKEKEVVNQWIKLEDTLSKYFQHSIHTNFVPTFNNLFENNNVSIRCQSTIQQILLDASKLQKYAIQIIDSSGKFPPAGVLEGTLTDLGRFDECIQVNHLIEGDKFPVSTRIKGQYCSLILRPPLPQRPRFHTLCNELPSLSNLSSSDSLIRWLGQNAHYFYYSPFRIGICSPSQCSPRDIHALVSKLASSFNFTAEILNQECEVDNSTSYSVNLVQLFIIFGFILFFVAIVIATIADVYDVGQRKTSSLTFLPGTIEFNDEITRKEISKGLPPQDVYWLTNGIHGKRAVPSELSSELSRSSAPSEDRVSLDNNSSNNKYWIKVLLCFSVKRSGSSILKLDDEPTTRPLSSSSSSAPSVSSSGSTTTPPASLGVIHGLRVVTMAWIILGHTYGLVNPQIHSQVFSASKLYTDPIFQPLLNATLSVDTFFFISGLLTVYVSWSRIVRTKSLPFMTFISMRYMRLTPSYAAVIAFSLVFPLLSSGPIWRESVDPVAANCYQTWWTNLLYVNNFVQNDKLCLMHSWYLSNDMQFHIFALIFLAILLKSKIVAFIYVAIAIVSCTAYSAIQTFVNDYPPTIVSTSPAVEERWRYILDYYYKPWPHLPSYCIGLVLGYMLSSRTRITISEAQQRITTGFMTLFALLVLYGVYPWNLGWKISPEVTAFYSATFRTIWTLCCAWAVYCMLVINPNGFVACCLSWKGLMPVSRLTYMAYLVHPFVIWYSSGSMRERFTATHFNYFHNFLGHYLLTYLIAFLAGVCFESPFMALSKLIVSNSTRTVEIVQRKPSVSIVSSADVSIGSSEGISSEEKSIGDPVTLKSYQVPKGLVDSKSGTINTATFVKGIASKQKSVSSSSLEKADSFLYHVTFDPENPNNHTTNVIVVNPA